MYSNHSVSMLVSGDFDPEVSFEGNPLDLRRISKLPAGRYNLIVIGVGALEDLGTTTHQNQTIPQLRLTIGDIKGRKDHYGESVGFCVFPSQVEGSRS